MSEPDEPLREPTSDQWRTFFAAERTLLAWVRTGLALMGFGFLVERFGLFLRQIAAVSGATPPRHGPVSVWFGVSLVLLGAVVLAAAGPRHLKAVRRFAGGTPLARRSASAAPLTLTALLALFGVALAGYLLILR